jgi:hypothetical protein
VEGYVYVQPDNLPRNAYAVNGDLTRAASEKITGVVLLVFIWVIFLGLLDLNVLVILSYKAFLQAASNRWYSRSAQHQICDLTGNRTSPKFAIRFAPAGACLEIILERAADSLDERGELCITATICGNVLHFLSGL